MNQRIKELALQAGFQYIKDEGIGWAGNHNASLPKFAELIVKEMLQTCEDHPAWTGRMVGERIKQHFGVEE